jgi:hypothetical protein
MARYIEIYERLAGRPLVPASGRRCRPALPLAAVAPRCQAADRTLVAEAQAPHPVGTPETGKDRRAAPGKRLSAPARGSRPKPGTERRRKRQPARVRA